MHHIALDTFLTAVVILVNTLFAWIVYLRNPQDKVNRLYGFMVLMISAWTIVNYESNHVYTHESQYVLNKLAFILGLGAALSVWLLSMQFPRRLSRLGFQTTVIGALTPVVTLLIAATSLIMNKVTYEPDKQLTSVSTGSLYLLYVLTIVWILAFIIRNFYKAYRLSDGRTKSQVSYSAIGIVLGFLWILFTSAIIPALTHNWGLSKIGNFGAVFLISFTGYAIVRHKLFDIRLILARSIAYTLSIGTFIVIYVGAAALVSSFLFKNYEASAEQLLVTIILMIILISTINPVRRFFDKMTNEIFYRDAYDPQLFLDKLNRTLIENIELGILLRHTTRVIEGNIKCEHATFVLYDEKNKPRYVGSDGAVEQFSNFQEIREAAASLKNKLVVYNDLEDGENQLKSNLRKNNIAILASLDTSNDRALLSKSYLCLGDKKSGNAYNREDVRIIEIIANELVIAIQNALRFEEIQNFNLTLQQRINDATRELRRANEKLKTLDETKDDFISMASHQLRTPLTSVKGYLSMVLEEDAGKLNKMQHEMLSQAFFSSQRMVFLIADLLNVSRLKTGKFIIEPVPVNLADLVEQEIGQLKETAASRDLTLTYDKPKEFPVLNLDETKTRQVIMNFVDNAIYYTPAGGHITVSLADKPSTVELRVKDDGIGVPKSEQPHLFTKFYRAGNARKARPDGTGLGLFMAKKVIIAEEGSLIFDSHQDKGSTFGFIFSKSKLGGPVKKPTDEG